jgi:hypothetical protein
MKIHIVTMQATCTLVHVAHLVHNFSLIHADYGYGTCLLVKAARLCQIISNDDTYHLFTTQRNAI